MKLQFELCDQPINTNFPIRVIQKNDGGVKKGPFYISIEDFVSLLKAEPENTFDADQIRSGEDGSPVLPLGTVNYASNQSKSRERITMEVPQKSWDIRYGTGEGFFTMPFPRMLSQYLVTHSEHGSTITEMRLYAILNDGKPVSSQTQLFSFPYPNVGKSNGIVCWGGNERLKVNSLIEVEKAFKLFISAPFNEDHGVRTTLIMSQFRNLIEEIQNKAFLDDWLVPLKEKVEDII